MTTSSSSNVREVVDSQEVRAREFLNSHPHIHYVNKEVFYFCYHKIQRLLDYNLLFPLLMSHELARNSDDAEKLTSSYHQPHDRHIALLQLAERGGEYGFMLLYMCISATCSESRGHAEAVGILDSEAQLKCIVPPWKRKPMKHMHSGSSMEGVGNSADEYPIQSPHSSIDGDNMQAGGKKRTVSTGTYDSRSSIESAGGYARRNSSTSSGFSSMTSASVNAINTPLESLPTARVSDDSEPLVTNEFEGLETNSIFSKLTDTFHSIVLSLLEHLEEDGVKVAEIKKHITILHLSQEPCMCTEQVDRLGKIESLYGLFHFLNTSVWNFMDYDLLDYVIARFGSNHIKQCMQQYITDLKEFKCRTTIHEFMECWPGRQKRLLKYDDLTVKFEKDPKCSTVKELDDFRQKMCVELLPRLSDYARFVMYHYKHAEGCFVITWILPATLATELLAAAGRPSSYKFFAQHQILSVSVRGREVYVDEKMITPDSTPMPLAKLSISSFGSKSTDLGYGSKHSLSTDLNSLIDSLKHSPDFSQSSSRASTMSNLTPTSEQDQRAEENLMQAVCALDPAELKRRLKVLEMKDIAIMVTFDNRLKRDERPGTDKGCYPSIALNNSGTTVELNHQMGTNFMFYRVGHVKPGAAALQWADPSSKRVPKKRYFGSGAYPRVTLNDYDVVVEVHKGQFMDRCSYRIGTIDQSSKKIDWGSSAHFNAGIRPDVAINNDNVVMVVFQDNVFTKQLFYRVGRLSKAGKDIHWITQQKQKVKHKENTRADSFALDINNNGLVVLAYQSPVKNHIHYRVGAINTDLGTIEWTKDVHKCIGFTPSVTLNDSDQVLMIHQSLTRRHLVSNVGVVRWSESFRGIDWSPKYPIGMHYGKGVYPSVAMNGRGEVVEVHEPRVAPNRNRLHYYVGKLMRYE